MVNQLLLDNFRQQPTQQQFEAFEKLAKFIQNRGPQDCFVLKGYAGTGKTSIISALTKTLPYLRMRSVLLAPTGRAAKVISLYSKREAYTIHKKIYRKKVAASIDLDFDLAENLHSNTLFIIDEASMIANESVSFFSSGILDDLVKYVESGENCNLLFIGDSAQLPPVGLYESPALQPAYLESNYGLRVTSHELTQVVRQDLQSGILWNATSIRQQINLDDPEAQHPFPKLRTSGFNDVYKMTGEKLIDGINYAYDNFGQENSIVICRSNRAANLYNQHIRNTILFRDEEITGGDQIMVNKNNYYWLQQENPEDKRFIANGDLAVVKRVSNIHQEHGFRFADLEMELQDMDDARITCRVLLDSLHVDAPSLPQESMKELYSSIELDYADIKDRKERLSAIKADPYYNALQIKFAYAITCHKAQGGEWPLVFIDQGYINEDMLNTEFLRWLYTAVTRAKTQLFLVNFHEEFYQ